MPIAQLISPEKLQSAQADTNKKLVILDCRAALDDLQYGSRSFALGHIAGARFADLEADLSGTIIPGQTGRHPLPDPESLLARLRTWGIDDDSEIVFYDDGPGAYAAHAWWLLVWLGKRDGLFLLDGGLKAWLAAGLPLSTDVAPCQPGTLTGQPDPALLIDAVHLQQRLHHSDMTLIDARALPRFRGEMEPIDPVAGHIPGAQCAVFTDNLDSDGHFLSAQQLKQRFIQHLGQRQPEDLVAYCGSGVTACHNLFAMNLAGYPLGRLYAGSWSEWITQAARPIATGG